MRPYKIEVEPETRTAAHAPARMRFLPGFPKLFLFGFRFKAFVVTRLLSILPDPQLLLHHSQARRNYLDTSGRQRNGDR